MTVHSIERARERASLSRPAAEKMISNAICYGVSSEEFHSREKAYLEHREREGSSAVVYSGYTFIVADNGMCITMYKTPGWFGKKYNYCGKEKIRSPKKYFTRYSVNFEKEYAI